MRGPYLVLSAPVGRRRSSYRGGAEIFRGGEREGRLQATGTKKKDTFTLVGRKKEKVIIPYRGKKHHLTVEPGAGVTGFSPALKGGRPLQIE